MRKTAATNRIFQRRQMAKLLGLPQLDLKDEEMLAGGDIKIEIPRSNFGPWLFGSILLSGVLGVLGWAWVLSWPGPTPLPSPKPPAPTPAAGATEYLEISVIPGS
jgi:hypothetical protein